MATMLRKSPSDARVELQAWYLGGLLPKLARAARTGVADPGAVEALDAEMRAFLDLPEEERDAA
jgi:hypothetical protein